MFYLFDFWTTLKVYKKYPIRVKTETADVHYMEMEISDKIRSGETNQCQVSYLVFTCTSHSGKNRWKSILLENLIAEASS